MAATEQTPLLDGSESSRFSIQSLREASRRFTDYINEHTGSIGYLGSISIIVNVLTGPAMLDLPATFARSGVIPTSLCILFIAMLASLASLHFANAVSKIPGNLDFRKEIEFSETFRTYLGHYAFVFSEIIFFCCITCLNISSIVDNGQVVDSFLGHWCAQGTIALQIRDTSHMEWIRWSYDHCTPEELNDGLCNPFDDSEDGILITAGNLITCLAFLPLALLDLTENVAWQILGFFVLLITSTQFLVEFTYGGLTMDYVTWWGSEWSDLFGVVLFNFSLVLLVPAWLYEREPHVDVATVIYVGNGFSALLYILIGLVGAMSMPNVSENMLESMLSGTFGPSMELGASIFSFFIIGLGIPLFSVLTRLNLTGSGLCSRPVGNIFAVYLPFLASFLMYDGKSVKLLLSWGGTIFTGFAAFLLPLALSLYVAKNFRYEGSIHVPGIASEEKDLTWLLVFTVISVCLALVGALFS